ncbi:hypothetical protein SAMN02745135_02345 [Caloranaerobacter azorensis DSM 13643]|uniref:Uncharacterized protein n=1 Tax=Caloranaerobacter azorensis DSM 13643 TaxID=1121264 RepID=A0A1M5W8E1_9FIRM|nr:hypothetical protein [Caloranaerobacter azorensis]SHH83782.1 hypothetical protein SAMN02745135_02345 [Caloranaerobacter azorensis DSM 13643]
MKRLISSFMILILIISLTGNVFAYNGETMQNNYRLPKNNPSIIEPFYVPCDYWPDGHHRWQDGKTDYDYVDTNITSREPILDDGREIGYKVYVKQKVYKIQEKYCACGATEKIKTYQGTRWKYVETVYY